jgi:hypothetical protein
MPQPGPLLSAAAAEEQIVIDLVVRGRALSIKYSHRRAFQPYYDGRVCVVGENVSPKSISLPPKIGRPIEGIADF